MPTIELLVGMIASGKSTYAQNRAHQGALIVSHDDLTEMLHGEYRYEAEKRGLYRRMEEAIAYQALLAGYDVVIDRTHLTIESRARWIEWAKSRVAITPVPVIAVTFPIEAPEIHAYRRVTADPRGRSFLDWLKVAQHHHAQAVAEPIMQNEGFADMRPIQET